MGNPPLVQEHCDCSGERGGQGAEIPGSSGGRVCIHGCKHLPTFILFPIIHPLFWAALSLSCGMQDLWLWPRTPSCSMWDLVP